MSKKEIDLNSLDLKKPLEEYSSPERAVHADRQRSLMKELYDNRTVRWGPWTIEEKAYIEANHLEKSVEEMAKDLNRNEKAITKYLVDNVLGRNEEEEEGFKALEKTPYWKTLKDQLTRDEIRLFRHHWREITQQFNEDILHTEEMQIIDLVKFEIMQSRIFEKNKLINDQIGLLNEQLDVARSAKKVNPTEVREISAQIEGLYRSLETFQKEHNSIHASKSKIFSALKATREQRIKQIENSKESFVDWIKELVKSKETRRELGLYMEKHRLATEIEYKRLSDFHTYEDGEIDIPVLSARTIDENNPGH